MGMSVGSAGGDEDQINSAINTTPLVDVMLVLLIIFLITVPVVRQTVGLTLPVEEVRARISKPDNVEISVDKAGDVYWGMQRLADNAELLNRLTKVAVLTPQPEVHIRGDEGVRYESVGRVVFACQQASILKISFVTMPPSKE